MKPEAFKKHQIALASKLLEPTKNLQQEADRAWNVISGVRYDFDQYTNDAALVSAITRQELVDFFVTFISPDSPRRHKMSVMLYSQKLTMDYAGKPLTSENVAVFKNARQLTAAGQQKIDLAKWSKM